MYCIVKKFISQIINIIYVFEIVNGLCTEFKYIHLSMLSNLQ